MVDRQRWKVKVRERRIVHAENLKVRKPYIHYRLALAEASALTLCLTEAANAANDLVKIHQNRPYRRQSILVGWESKGSIERK